MSTRIYTPSTLNSSFNVCIPTISIKKYPIIFPIFHAIIWFAKYLSEEKTIHPRPTVYRIWLGYNDVCRCWTQHLIHVVCSYITLMFPSYDICSSYANQRQKTESTDYLLTACSYSMWVSTKATCIMQFASLHFSRTKTSN